jgi:hypothetical protein
MPKIKNIMKYKVSWQKWWQGLQPKWRRLDDGTLSQEVPDINETWICLRRGGPNGIFVIVLAFSWWVKATDGIDDDKELHDALEDIIWVINHMAEAPALSGQLAGRKHAQEDELRASVKKR